MYIIKRYVTPTHNIKNIYINVKLHTSSTVLRMADIGTLLGSFQNLLTNSLSGHSITKLQTGRAISVSAGSINPARANLPNCLSGVFVSVNAPYIFHDSALLKQREFLRVYR